jgi:CDGSH-type Zn-finger protein
MEKGKIAQKGPYAVEVEAGKVYFWCSCGRSRNQPFCDSSHKDTGLNPVRWKAEESGTKYFCGCKQTDNRPFCDGTQNNL